MSLHAELVRSVLDAPATFAEVATRSPETAVLFAVGALLVAATVATMAWLLAGAAVDLVTPPPEGRTHRPG